MQSRTLDAAGSSISLESVLGFFCLLIGIFTLVLVDLVDPLSPQVFGIVSLATLAATAYLTWRQTEQGNHPIFLFMVFLALFQFGRMISGGIAGQWTMSSFDLAVGQPFLVSDSDIKQAMLLVPLSAAFIYLGFFGRACQRVLTFTEDRRMRTFFAWLYFLTIPFVVIKDVAYLRYTLEHGGYVATYLGGGEHVEQVGVPIRALALLNMVAFLPYLIVETRRRYLQVAITSFLLMLVLELLVGVRGKFFIHLMFLWMVYNIKTGSSFKPVTAVAGALVLLVAAVAAEVFREQKSALDVNLVEYFFHTQGSSFYVTLSSVLYSDVFQSRSVSYLANQFLLPFRHINTFPDGSLLSPDLTMFLNPASAKHGFGTGDAYLANLYLLGGYAAVCIGSWLLGLFCAAITRAGSVFWQTIALSILMWIPYLPRSGYFEPVANAVKYFVMAAGGFGLYALYASIRASLELPRFEVTRLQRGRWRLQRKVARGRSSQ